jgi:hypothetical protein
MALLRHAPLTPLHPARGSPSRCRRFLAAVACRHVLPRAFAALLIAIASTWSGGLAAQARSIEYQVKAVFLYNFVQFTEWPDSTFASKDAPIRIGVLGEDPFRGALEEVLRGETIRNRRVVVTHSHDLRELAQSHVLFVGKSERGRVAEVLSGLNSAPVLTVGEIEGFARRGGTINFYLEDDKVRFEINPESTRERGLRMSSQLLALGRIVATEPGIRRQ